MKLSNPTRCVRQSADRNVPCDRCRKAGSECINTFDLQRKRPRIYVDDEVLPGRRVGHTGHIGFDPADGCTTVSDGSAMMYTGLLGTSDLLGNKSRPTSQRHNERFFRDVPQSQQPECDAGGIGSGFHHPAASGGPPFTAAELGSQNAMDIFHLEPDADTFDFGIQPIPTSGTAAEGPALPSNPAPPTTSITAPHPCKSEQECLDCLSELCHRLHKTAKLDYTTLEGILSFGCGRASTQASTATLKNAIGYTLEISQDFLTIVSTLRNLLSSPEASDPASPASSTCSYSDLVDDSALDTGDFPEDGGAPFASPSRAGDNRLKRTSANPSTASTSSSTANTCLDLPATLMTLTSYLRLLHLYDIIFTCIHTSLSGSPSSSTSSSTSTPSGPRSPQTASIIPNLTIGGFDLNDRKDLQIEVLIHLSEHMLGRIEAALGIDVWSKNRHGPTETGILERHTAVALLEVMSRQHEEGTGNALRVHRTMGAIRKTLRADSLEQRLD